MVKPTEQERISKVDTYLNVAEVLHIEVLVLRENMELLL